MKAFASWSSGKDCMHALYHFLKNPENQAICLLNMSGEGDGQLRSYGISSAMIGKQSAQLSVPLLQKNTSRGDYEKNMKEAITSLKSEGFKTIFVSIRKEQLPQSFPDKVIDNDFLTDMHTFSTANPCAENEYHTFVFDGPLFAAPVLFEERDITKDDNHWF